MLYLRTNVLIMEIRETNYKRFIASDGKALRWKEKSWNYQNKCEEDREYYSDHEALIDESRLVEKVVEVPYSEYIKWSRDKEFCLHPLFERK